jgi:hypothetical protein
MVGMECLSAVYNWETRFLYVVVFGGVPMAFLVSFVGGLCIGFFGRLTAIIVASLLYGVVLVQQLLASEPRTTILQWFASLVLLQGGYVTGSVLRPILRRQWRSRKIQ